ncbi:hypothetical protein [Mycoplasma zalophidermidis]|uniref:hypothetical protein n=1 Tax=Mycoplasma zalophidermidis TaxID=398174 RepID=UPI00215D2607|nr:hypothetical protein [Mycoplasma zalophidermidis]MCR8966890.1 hypothetical protein [Mycoplasma zalophidermidis]
MKRKFLSLLVTSTALTSIATILSIINFVSVNNLNFIDKNIAINDIRTSKNKFEMVDNYKKWSILNKVNKISKISDAKNSINTFKNLTDEEKSDFINRLEPILINKQSEIDDVINLALSLNNSKKIQKNNSNLIDYDINQFNFIDNASKKLFKDKLLKTDDNDKRNNLLNSIQNENNNNKKNKIDCAVNEIKQLISLTNEDIAEIESKLIPGLINSQDQINKVVSEARFLNTKRETIHDLEKSVSVADGTNFKENTIKSILENKSLDKKQIDKLTDNYYLEQINKLIDLGERETKPRQEIKEALQVAKDKLKNEGGENIRDIYEQLVDSTIKFTSEPNKLEGVNIFHISPPATLYSLHKLTPFLFNEFTDFGNQWEEPVKKYLMHVKNDYDKKFKKFIKIAADPRLVSLEDQKFYGSYFYSILNKETISSIFNKNWNLNNPSKEQIEKLISVVLEETKKSEKTPDFDYINSINRILIDYSKVYNSYTKDYFCWDYREDPITYYENIERNNLINAYDYEKVIHNYKFRYNPYLKAIVSKEEIDKINNIIDFSVEILTKNIPQIYTDAIYIILDGILVPSNKDSYLQKLKDKNFSILGVEDTVNHIQTKIESNTHDLETISNIYLKIKKTYPLKNNSFQKLVNYIFTNGNLHDFSFLSFMVEYDPSFRYALISEAPTHLYNMIDTLPISDRFKISKESLKQIFIEFHQLLDAIAMQVLTPEQAINKLQQNAIYDFIWKFQMFVNNLPRSEYMIDKERNINDSLLELKSTIEKSKEIKNVGGVYFDAEKLNKLANKHFNDDDSQNKLTLQIINLFLVNDLLYNKYPSRFYYRFFGLGERAIKTIVDIDISRLNSLYPLITENIELFKNYSSSEKITQNEILKNISFADVNNIYTFLGKITSANKVERQKNIKELLRDIDDIINKVSAIPDLNELKIQLEENKSIIQEIVKKIDNETDLSFNYKVRLDALKPISDADFYDELSKKGKEYIRLMVAIAPFKNNSYNIKEFIRLFTDNENNSDNVILNSLFGDKKHGFIQKYGESDTLYSSSHHYFNDYVSAEWKSEWDSKKHLLDQFKDDIHINYNDNNNYANSISLSESNKNKFTILNSMVSNIFDSLKSKLFNAFITHYKVNESKEKFNLNKLSYFNNYSNYTNESIKNVKHRYDKVYEYLSDIIYNGLLQVDGNVLKKIGDEFGWNIYNNQLFLFVTMNIAQNYDKIKVVLDKINNFVNSITIKMTDAEMDDALNTFISQNDDFFKKQINSLDKLQFNHN